MKITYGSKHELKSSFKGCKSYEFKLWLIKTKVVDSTKLHLSPREWGEHLLTCIRIGVNLNAYKFWINFIQ